MIEGRFGDTPEFVWLSEVLNRAVVEHGDRLAVDMNLLIAMCRDEPKNAYVAMQLLAQDVKQLIGDMPVTQAEGLAANLCFVLGSIFKAYWITQRPDGAEFPGPMPQDLEYLVQTYPIIMKCVNAIPEQQHGNPWSD